MGWESVARRRVYKKRAGLSFLRPGLSFSSGLFFSVFLEFPEARAAR
jgi:hypothetical protein